MISAYRIFCSQSQIPPEDLRLAHVMGWCIEMVQNYSYLWSVHGAYCVDVFLSFSCIFYQQLQAFMLVLDDFMDSSETRRGRPCWYKVNDNGTIAINDGILLENGIYVILKKYFSDKPYYTQVLETFHDVRAIVFPECSDLGKCINCHVCTYR